MKMLRLRKKTSPKIRFVGSCLQQNHGENLRGHGYSLWDLSTRTYTHHELENNYGYYTIELYNGELKTNLDNLPPKLRLRVKCYKTIASEVKAILADIKKTHEIIEVSYVRMDTEETKESSIISKHVSLNDLTSSDYQNKLITDFLKNKIQITNKDEMQSILDLNTATNAAIKQDSFSRNLKWKFIRFEFDNMFTYGENNVIDFTQLNGIYGIFGPNKVGKSSILSAISFCLFDKFDRGFKGLHVMNIEKSSFRCKLELEIDGIHYFIERTGTTTRTGNVKVDVKFWRIINGTEEELHGTARRDTNELIRDYVGTYEDFILTTLSVQTAKNNISFVDMGHSDRKDLLVKFIGLHIFDKLHEEASVRSKELVTLLKMHKDKNYSDEKNAVENNLTQTQSIFSEKSKKLEDVKSKISDINSKILSESSKLIGLDANVSTDLEELTASKDKVIKLIEKEEEEIKKTTDDLAAAKEHLESVEKELAEVVAADLSKNYTRFNELGNEVATIKQEIQTKKTEIAGRLEKVERLDSHEYDPNCKYCVNNSFVQDALNSKQLLIEDKKEADVLLRKLSKVNEEYKKYQWVDGAYQKYTEKLTYKSRVKDLCSQTNERLFNSKNSLEKYKSELKSVENQITLYYQHKIAVENNKKISGIVSAYKSELVGLEAASKEQSKVLMELNEKIGAYKNKISDLSELIEEIKELEYESNIYKIYLSTIHRDGIPYEIIKNTVPEIESEVNSILNQVVEYSVELETDGKNIVPYIVYDQRKWPIEMSSGFERFVFSIAIRVALTNISNLPKTNFLAVDEGFGTLDSDNLSSMSTLFSYLRNNYDFIFVVSHIDALKDAVDKSIEIVQENNFSRVNYPRS